jgi:hypothetical protein
MAKLTKREAKVVELLGEAATAFRDLEPEHPSDQEEFVRAIHAAQNVVLSRVGVRSLWKGSPRPWQQEEPVRVFGFSDRSEEPDDSDA